MAIEIVGLFWGPTSGLNITRQDGARRTRQNGTRIGQIRETIKMVKGMRDHSLIHQEYIIQDPERPAITPLRKS